MKHPPKCAVDGCTSQASVLVIRRWLRDEIILDSTIDKLCDEHAESVRKGSVFQNHETTIRRLKK